jgi:hypothetical protein
MGTTASGLRYPEPTDPVNQGADAIKNLATDVDALMKIDATRVLGTLGNMGTYNSAKPWRMSVAYTFGSTDSTGQFTWTPTPGIKAIAAAWCLPFYQSAEMLTVQWILRLEQSSLTGLRFMARNTTDGSAYASARMGMIFTAVVQL